MPQLTRAPMVTLFDRAVRVDSIPFDPDFHRDVNDPLMRKLVAQLATELNYGVR